MAEPQKLLWTISAGSDTMSTSVKIPSWAEYASIYVPPRTDGVALTLKFDPTEAGTSTDLVGIRTINTATDLALAPDTSTDGCIYDVTSWLQSYHGDVYIIAGSDLSEALTGYFYFKG